MRVQSHATTVSWIPSEAVTGPMKATFSTGVSHYDEPPPGALGDLEALRDSDGFRFANRLDGIVDFLDGVPSAWGQSGGVVMGSTTVGLGVGDVTFAAVTMPDLRPQPEIGDSWVRFVQTCGGRTALPLPRRISKPPYARMQSPLVWTTLGLTIHADGHSEIELIGASPFPRHWVYDDTGALSLKAGYADWRSWLGQTSWHATPWGDQDSPVVVAQAESALERELSTLLMHGGPKPKIRSLRQGDVLAQQGSPGDSLFLVLDGILSVDVDGREVGEVGPGTVLGERAILEGANRTSTLTATTPVRVAEAPAESIDRAALTELATMHRREYDLDAVQ